MRKLFLAFALGMLFVPAISSAHSLKTDGSIGAVLHIDPNDDPVVGQAASFFFEIKDKSGKFKHEVCDCQMTILQKGQELASISLNNGTADYVFPAKGAYKIVAIGKPTDASFQPFTLKYDVRVERVLGEKTGLHVHWGHILLGVGVVLFVAIYIWQVSVRRKPKTKSREKKPIDRDIY